VTPLGTSSAGTKRRQPACLPPEGCNCTEGRYRRANHRVENDLYGGILKPRRGGEKLALKKYTDDAKPHAFSTWCTLMPRSKPADGVAVALNDQQQESAAMGRCTKSPHLQHLACAADAEFSWSEALGSDQRFHFDHTYVVGVETSAKFDGAPILAG